MEHVMFACVYSIMIEHTYTMSNGQVGKTGSPVPSSHVPVLEPQHSPSYAEILHR